MKYGAMNFPIKPLSRELEDIGAMGFDYVELTLDPPEASPQKVLAHRKTIHEILHRYALGIVGHLPTFVRTSDLYESLRRASVQEMVCALEAGSELGIKKMVLHPGYSTGLGRFVLDRVKQYAMESLDVIVKKANTLGITLCVENMLPQTQFLSNPHEFEEVFHAFPDLRLALDIGHANLGGGRNKSSEFIQRFGYRLGHVHANDNFGRNDSHLPVGAGTIDFEKILRELRGIEYDETITVEVFSKDKDYLRISRDKIKRMWDRS